MPQKTTFLTKGGTTKRIGPIPKIPKAPKKTTTTKTTRTTSKPKTPTAYDPFHIPTLEEMKAEALERQNQYTQTGLAALPTEAAIRAPYDRQGQDVQGLTQALVGMLGKLQTQQQQIGTGQVQALQTDQARMAGMTPALGQEAAGSQAVLAALGTSAPNIMAANQAAAGASGAIYGRGIAQRATDAVSARTQEAAKIKAEALNAYSKHLDDLQQRAFQTGVAKQNYQLASGEAQFNQDYKTAGLQQDATKTAAQLRADAAKLAETQRHNLAGEKIAAQKAAAAAAKATAAGNPKKAAALQKAWLSALKDAHKQLDTVKPTSSKANKVTGFEAQVRTNTDDDAPTFRTAYFKVGPDGRPIIPVGTRILGTPKPISDTVTTTTKGAYWPAFKKARSILQQANGVYGIGLTPAEITQILQQYAPSPSTKTTPLRTPPKTP